MKTPMQELIKHFKIRLSSTKEVRATAFDEMKRALDIQIEELELCILSAEAMLEKEEEMIKKAWWAGCDEGASDHKIYPSEDCNGYYNETFNTKER